LIAITPEKQEGIAKTNEKTKASYPIITDDELKIMKAYDVAYQVDTKTIDRYKMASIDLAANNGQKPMRVSSGACRIYNRKDGEIKYRFFEEDYKKQASVKDILNNLVG
jgi:uncharacterized protein (DUF342 family)